MCKRTEYRTSNTHIDRCIRPLITFLRDQDYKTVASCCGHGKYTVTVVIMPIRADGGDIWELFTCTRIPRSRRFYKKDKEGYYYIPEAREKTEGS